jgi:FlaG/FlaF family flagellin (archaellin)
MDEHNKDTEPVKAESSQNKNSVGGIVATVVVVAVIIGLIAIIGSSASNPNGSTVGDIAASAPAGCNNPTLQQQAQAVNFQQLDKDPASFNGTDAEFTGQVLQIQQSNGQGYIRLAVVPLGDGIWSPSFNDVVWVTYQGNNSAVQGDVINVYGPLTGEQTYTSEANYTITIPSMMGCIIQEASSSPSVSAATPTAPVINTPTQPSVQNPTQTKPPAAVQPAPTSQTPTPPPTPKSWHTVTTITTANTENTPPFTIQGTEWRATWSCQAALPVNTTPTVFAESTDGTGGGGIVAEPSTCPSGDTTYFYNNPGSYYLQVDIYDPATMTVTIEDYY